MSFFRPEAMTTLRRYREIALCLAAVAFGLWVYSRGGLFYAVLGLSIATFSLGLSVAAWRRLRFAISGEAPGVLTIDEGAIAYFGPVSGGAVALSELTLIEILPQEGQHAWRLSQADGHAITIPTGARGAERLFDVFGALPGARAETFIAALAHPPQGPRRLWMRRGTESEPGLPRP